MNGFPQPISNFHVNESTSNDSNSENLSISTSDKSTHFSLDKKSNVNASATSNVKDDTTVHNQLSLPKSSTLVEDLLKV